MKRSEMVEVIMDKLSGELNFNTMPLIVASELLAKLEEKGMIPPIMEFEIAGKMYRDNGWDKEDEEMR